FASLFARQMKLFILVMFLLSAGCFTVFALVLVQVIPSSYAILYISVIGGNTLVNSAVPLIYELGCELAYPTSEGAANGFLTYLNNVGGLIFLAVFLIPNV
ncbi:disrupted in renal carcinoma protein 2, partial [Biomphalaria glabrata]